MAEDDRVARMEEAAARQRAAPVAAERVAPEPRSEATHRDEFLAMLAHELRSPLASIVSAAELLLRSDPARSRSVAETILRQAQHQARLVSDLLDAARVRQGKIALRPVRLDLREPVREAVAATEHERAHGVRLHLRLPERAVWVLADATRLTQCLSNLLGNAAKFTPGGGDNWLSIEESGVAYVRVQDNGQGIEPELLPHLFEPFTQADRSLGRRRGGLGLGLSLTHKLMSLQAGGVRADSDGPGRGACFTLWLPRLGTSGDAAAPGEEEGAPAAEEGAPAAEEGASAALGHDAAEEGASAAPGHDAAEAPPCAAPATAGPGPGPGGVRRVLLVEDNPDVSEMLRELLLQEGFEVSTAPDGLAGAQAALQERPDAVVSDLGLPELDGIGMAERIRGQLPASVFIALSGYSRLEERERAERAGFDVYLVKPINVADLVRTLRDCQATTAHLWAAPPPARSG